MQFLFLDTNLLGQLCHPKAEKFEGLKSWTYQLLKPPNDKIYRLCLPEISDYELRRKLIHLALQNGVQNTQSLTRLNAYRHILHYIPIQTNTMLQAAQLWAEARSYGIPTASPDSLDGDVILAAQVKELNGVALTTNKKHLSRFVPVADWQDISLLP